MLVTYCIAKGRLSSHATAAFDSIFDLKQANHTDFAGKSELRKHYFGDVYKEGCFFATVLLRYSLV